MSIKPIDSHQVYSFVDQMAKKATDPIVCAIAFACLGIAVIAVTTTFTAALIAGGLIAVLGSSILLGVYLSEKNTDNSSYPIEVGIPNIGNSCWLNSALKFMASTDYYDSMLSPRIDNKQELRNALRQVFNFLREEKYDLLDAFFSDEPIQLEKDLLKELRKQIGKHMPDFQINGRQHDSQEFILALTAALNWDPQQKVETISYRASNRQGAASHNNKVASDFLSVKIIDNGVFNLQTAIHDQQIGGDEADSRIRMPTKLPDNLMIHVGHNPELGHEKRPTLETNNGLVTLFESQLDEDGIASVKRTVTYRVRASLIQNGSENSGHWVCSIRGRKGHELHNDSAISIHPADTIELNGCFIHFVKVK